MEVSQFEFKILLKLGRFEKMVNIRSSSSRLGIMGPSGCGKTSLAKSLAGIHSFVSGDIKFRGQLLNGVSPWDRNFGYLPQDLLLLPHLSVAENILFPVGSGLSPDIIEGLHIKDLMQRMPRHLSGGEKQRVALARAMSMKPKLLILDEPFSSLDVKMKDQVVSFLDKFLTTHQIPLFLISHSETELKSLSCEIFSFESSP